MGNKHLIVEQLSKLRESSKEAIADSNVELNDALKDYLHIQREVEIELIEIVKNASSQKKKASLILVCGNVGDGKSHILSNLQKNDEIKPLLAKFQIHNDATESFSPKKGCIETLDDILNPFKDNNIENSTTKQIIAINLGTLSNFIAEKGEKYESLKEYILNNKIVEANGIQHDHVKDKVIQHVNFTDHHLYALTSNGGESVIVNELLKRVSANDKRNPVYKAYLKIKNEEWFDQCIVKSNYEFLFEEKNRKQIGNLILQLQVSQKQIISIRHLLNFVHDLIVPPRFANLSLEHYILETKKLTDEERLNHYLPIYIFEHPSLSPVYKGLSQIDPCRNREEQIDDHIVKIHTSKTIQSDIFTKNEVISKLNLKNIYRTNISKAYIRINSFFHEKVELFNGCFKEYLKALYCYNINDERGLKHTHLFVENAILRWNGNNNTDHKVMIHMDAAQNQYRLFKNLEISIKLNKKGVQSKIKPLSRFSTELKFDFQTNNDEYSIKIDYPLYTLLRKINKGYRPNKLDRNNYIHFTKFVEDITLNGAEQASIYIDEVNIDQAIDFVLEIDAYGDFKFEKRN